MLASLPFSPKNILTLKKCFSTTWTVESPNNINFTLYKEKHFLKFPNQSFLKIKMSKTAK